MVSMLTLPRTLAAILLLTVLPACSSCPGLPNGGKADTPEHFGQVFRHAVKKECWDVSYDLLSPVSRAEIPYAGWWLKAETAELPGTSVKVVKFITDGESLAFVPNTEAGVEKVASPDSKLELPRHKEYFWLFQYSFPDTGEVRLFKFLVVREGGPEDAWRLGFQDQINRNISFSAE